MIGFKKVFAGLATAAAMASAGATPITVGGVTWDPDSLLDFNGVSATLSQTINLADGSLSGFGAITSINGQGMSSFCSSCELTFQYGGFTPAGVGMVPSTSATSINYTGGWLKVYVGARELGSVNDYLNINNLSSANTGNGSLWLDLAGHAVAGFTLQGIYSESLEQLSGGGLFDVVGGLAEDNFDTNTRKDGADLSFSTTFTNLFFTGPVPAYATGSATFKGNTIPEPSSIALMGLALAGVGAIARRRKQA